ncbi:MAG TPA: right-handed parallel beta-helix repeat-containing protein, partial [Kofleriaceae bacterium]|nr:right-handed parallel beta-helix repeat-containing protein [Kofleriaceae bacterium]
MGSSSCWLVMAALAGCGRVRFEDRAGGTGSAARDSGTDTGLTAVTCDRLAVTTPTYWADTNLGLDTNPGTQAEPTKTIAEAITLASSTGGTVIVAPGNYLETLDISTTVPLLLLSEQRYRARIDRLNCAFCQDLAVDGFEITGSSLPLVSINGGTRVTFHDNVVYDGGSAGIRVTAGAQSIDVSNNVIYATVGTALHVNVATGITIRNNVVFGFNTTPLAGEQPIWLESSTDATVAGNVVFRWLGDDTNYGVISLRATTGTTLVENNLIAGSPNATSVYASIGFDQGGGTAIIRHNTF